MNIIRQMEQAGKGRLLYGFIIFIACCLFIGFILGVVALQLSKKFDEEYFRWASIDEFQAKCQDYSGHFEAGIGIVEKGKVKRLTFFCKNMVFTQKEIDEASRRAFLFNNGQVSVKSFSVCLLMDAEPTLYVPVKRGTDLQDQDVWLTTCKKDFYASDIAHPFDSYSDKTYDKILEKN